MAKFQPKGGMCRTCEMVEHDCSGMKFDEMPVIESADFGKTLIVKCVNYRKNKPVTEDNKMRVPIDHNVNIEEAEAMAHGLGADIVVECGQPYLVTDDEPIGYEAGMVPQQ